MLASRSAQQIEFQLTLGGNNDIAFRPSSIPAVNVATVPQRSPLRYPGGKTWLVPHIREWLLASSPVETLVEPFAGGGIVSLTAVMEGLAERALLIELDRDVAAFWRAAFDHTEEMISRIRAFEPTRAHIEALCVPPADLVEHGFRTLVLNRTRRGGVLAPGAALTKLGENGNGVASRWYPETLVRRLKAIAEHAHRITFCEGDGVSMLELLAGSSARFFVDPPYTARGGKRAGSRLYAHSEIDHARVFKALAGSGADFLMTYDCSAEVAALVAEHGFNAVTVHMKNAHHARIPELIITRDPLFA